MNSTIATPTVFDPIGHHLFSRGDLGAAHVLVHRCMERGRLDLGQRTLGPWLDARSGEGSEWVHLHWHQLVFELATGHWSSARRRFDRHIRPAVSRGEALTDAPQALWRMALLSPIRDALPWAEIAEAAEKHLGQANETIEFHNLLALAGAGEVSALEAWLRQARTASPELRLGAEALRSYLLGDYVDAASSLATLAHRASSLGGSQAQAELLELIRRDAAMRCHRAA